MEDKFGLAIVGCGAIVNMRLPSILAADSMRLVACMDPCQQAAAQVAAKSGTGPLVLTDFDALLARSDVDVVYLATPHYLHAPQTIAAAQAGKHVIVEKPMATALADAERMIATCDHAGVGLSVCFTMRYSAPARAAKRLLEAGVLGQPLLYQTVCYGYKGEDYWQGTLWPVPSSSDWRRHLSQVGGGILIMNSVHYLDLVYWLTGERVTRVHSELGNFGPPLEFEDEIHVVMRYVGGAIGLACASSVRSGRGCDSVRLAGTEGEIVISGSSLRAFCTTARAGLSAGEWQDVALEPAPSEMTAFLNDFAQAVRDRRETPISGREGIESLRIILGAYEAGSQGRAVQLT